MGMGKKILMLKAHMKKMQQSWVNIFFEFFFSEKCKFSHQNLLQSHLCVFSVYLFLIKTIQTMFFLLKNINKMSKLLSNLFTWNSDNAQTLNKKFSFASNEIVHLAQNIIFTFQWINYLKKFLSLLIMMLLFFITVSKKKTNLYNFGVKGP